MKTETNTKKKLFFILKILAVTICTIIGGYGILHAPESDKNELEQSLRQNERELEQEIEKEIGQETTQESGQQSPPDAVSPAALQAPSPEPQKTLTVIGDSVFLGASHSFKKLVKYAVIDAKVSRQVYQALDVAKKLDKKKKLGDTVIISLGINGNFNPSTGQALIDYLGPDRTIYWINAFGKEKEIEQEVNRTIRNLAHKNNNVFIIPWASEGKKHPDWFYQDGTHLNEKGQEGFAQFVTGYLTS